MKVLSIGTDRKLFERSSAVLLRSQEYASKMEELHVVVFSLRSQKLSAVKIGNLYIYPTNSFSRWTYAFSAIRLAKKIIVGNNFVRGRSVITCQDPFECGYVGYRISRYFRLPLQLQIHTDFLSSYFKNSFLNRVRFAMAKFLIPKVTGLRVVSEVIASSVKEVFINLKVDVSVLPVFVDVEALISAPIVHNIRQDFLQYSSIIFMASRLTAEKRIETALLALQKVMKTTKDIGLIIAGNGQEESVLQEKVKSLGLSGHVQFIGWRDDLISYYKTATMFLCTSEYEGYGMTLIEAGASGCPIITTEVGIASTELFKNGVNCYVCEVGDIIGISDSIVSLMQDYEKRELFRNKMQASIKNISVPKDEYVSKFVSILEKLL